MMRLGNLQQTVTGASSVNGWPQCYLPCSGITSDWRIQYIMQYIPVPVHVHKQKMNSKEPGDSDNLLDFLISYVGIGRYFIGRDEPTNTVATRCGQLFMSSRNHFEVQLLFI